MAGKVKIAVSLSPDVVELLDRHAEGRSRSRCVDEELRRALRAREWERLSSQMTSEEADELTEWAGEAFAAVDRDLAREEQGERAPRRTGRRRR